MQMLINAGANVNVVNRWRESPLTQAAADNRPQMDETLINAGANVNFMSDRGTALISQPVMDVGI